MRWTSPVPLNGQLDPVRLTFASDRLVYPMRLSAQAATPQRVVIYTLGAHRLQRTDPDAATQLVDVDFVGLIADPRDPTRRELVAGGDYLTRISTQIADPATITSDFEFAAAPTDEPYQRVIRRHEDRDATPLLLGTAPLAAAGALWVARRRS